jgi:heat shock protein HtpX
MFTYIKRFFFFFLTNFAILALISVIMAIVNYFYPWLISAYWGNVSLLIYAAIFGFVGSFISLFLSKWSAKRFYNIQLLDVQKASSDTKLQLVWETVERISQMNHISMPEVGYYESSDPNAFATWSSKNNSLVAVSTGLLDMMEKKEIEWVIGHEMAHILNGDMVTLTLIQWIMNTFVIFFSHIAARLVSTFFSSSNDEWEWLSWLTYSLVTIVFQMIFGFLAMFVVMWFSRMREYRADIGWAQFTNKWSMIAWLKKLQSITQKSQSPLDPKMTAFMINEPDSFFSTHPSLVNRIRALEENYQLN